MSVRSSPLCSERQYKAVEQKKNSIKYVDESHQMTLHDAVNYFCRRVTVVFLVIGGIYISTEHEAVAEGDMFIYYGLKKTVSFLKLNSGSACVTVPVVTQTEFALTPLSQEANETVAAIRRWEGEFHSVSEFFEARNMPMPAALKVLDRALDHSKKEVTPGTLLFNIRPVTQNVGLRKRRGIEAVDSQGAVYTFLEGKHSLHFSTKLIDVKCSPMCFLKTLHFPQTAMVYMHPNVEQEKDEGVRSLKNLSIVTFTGVTHDQHLVVKKLSDDENRLERTFTVPLSAPLEVVAVKLKDSQLVDRISGQRCVKNPKPKVEATKDDNTDRPLPPTPEEGHTLATTSPDEEGLYDEPQELQDCMGQATDSTPPDTSTDDNGYTRVGRASLPAQEGGHNVDAEQVRPERLDDSRASEQGFPLPTKAVQRSFRRHDTVPLHRSPSPSPRRRRHTVCKELASCPKEIDLRSLVAAKLGQDWRKVCSYLGLQQYQLHQAEAAHTHLEEKAMEALVMWVQGQGESKAPRSWKTLVEALCRAHRNDIACDLEI